MVSCDKGGVTRSESKEHCREDDGRSAKIDTGYYEVQVWGDTGDSFEEVVKKTERLADRAKSDVVELMDDTNDKQYY